MNKIRDMKVRVKILLGFTTVIVLTLIAFIFITLSNFVTVKNVNTIEENVMFQGLMNDLLQEFNEADKQAHIIYEIIDEDTALLLESKIKDVYDKFDTIYSLYEEKPSLKNTKESIDEIKEDFDKWHTSIDTVIEQNEELDKTRANLAASGSVLNQAISDFMGYQMENLRKVINDNEELSIRQIEQLELADKINNKITAIRVASRTLQYSFDISLGDGLYTDMNEVAELADLYKKNSISNGRVP